jgi:hypothetical protein
VIGHFITSPSIETEQLVRPIPDIQPPWRLGLLTDGAGRVHLGALIPASMGQPDVYVDLLAPVGADSVANLDLGQLRVIVQGERLADLHRIIVTCVDDARLRQRLLDLAALAGAQG